jgi:hypothetical protein
MREPTRRRRHVILKLDADEHPAALDHDAHVDVVLVREVAQLLRPAVLL